MEAFCGTHFVNILTTFSAILVSILNISGTCWSFSLLHMVLSSSSAIPAAEPPQGLGSWRATGGLGVMTMASGAVDAVSNASGDGCRGCNPLREGSHGKAKEEDEGFWAETHRAWGSNVFYFSFSS